MPIPLDPRKQPTDVKVRVSTGEGVDIKWSDGHSSHYDFTYLRDRCPCAHCRDERKKKESLKPPPTAGAVLPMFKPKATAKSAGATGAYAIHIEFTDGHSTGIYSFGYLREICPCADCKEAFRMSPDVVSG